MDILIAIIYTFIFIFLIYRLKFFTSIEIEKYWLTLLFVLKVIAGIVLVLIYIYHYKTRSSADIFRYFDDGNILFKALKDNPADYFRMLTGIGSESEHLMKYYNEMGFWLKGIDYNLYNDNRTVIRLNGFIRLFSFGSIYAHTVFFAFLSFVGLTAIYKIFINNVRTNKWILLIAAYLIPSVLFWTSGVLKEAILMFGFGIFLYSIYILFKNPKSLFYYLILMLSIIILFLSKFYILIAALPGIFSILLFKLTSKKYKFLKFLTIHLISFIILINSQIFIKKYNFLEIISKKQKDFIAYVDSLQHVGSKIDIPKVDPTVFSLIKNSPNAFFNTLLRPFIWEVNSVFSLLAAFENLILIALIIVSFIYRKSNYVMNDIIYFSISFTFILFILSGLTTPVIGALVRYKVPSLPFFVVIFFDLLDHDKLKLKINSILRTNENYE